jgi:hydrogenase maturation protease
MPGEKKVAVLGIGNPLCRDDGAGIRVIEIMRSGGMYPHVDFIDGGTSPDLLTFLDEPVEKLVIVDALRAGGTPGLIYRLEIKEENLDKKIPDSLHGMGIIHSLQLMSKLGRKLPRIVIIGIEPDNISPGLSLTSKIQESLSEVVALVEKELNS